LAAQIFDAIGHFIRLKNGCQQFEKAHPIVDAVLVLLTKDDARACNATGGKANVVSVISAETEATCCPLRCLLCNSTGDSAPGR
jgi:hypothetical protein